MKATLVELWGFDEDVDDEEEDGDHQKLLFQEEQKTILGEELFTRVEGRVRSNDERDCRIFAFNSKKRSSSSNYVAQSLTEKRER